MARYRSAVMGIVIALGLMLVASCSSGGSSTNPSPSRTSSGSTSTAHSPSSTYGLYGQRHLEHFHPP